MLKRKELLEIGKEGWPTLGEALTEAKNYLHWHDLYDQTTGDVVPDLPTEIEDY